MVVHLLLPLWICLLICGWFSLCFSSRFAVGVSAFGYWFGVFHKASDHFKYQLGAKSRLCLYLCLCQPRLEMLTSSPFSISFSSFSFLTNSKSLLESTNYAYIKLPLFLCDFSSTLFLVINTLKPFHWFLLQTIAEKPRFLFPKNEFRIHYISSFTPFFVFYAPISARLFPCFLCFSFWRMVLKLQQFAQLR